MKPKRLLWAGGILTGLMVGVPLLLWSGYAVRALMRHEHFYHGLPSSWWQRQLTLMGPDYDPQQGMVTGKYADFARKLARSQVAPVTDYIGLSYPCTGGGLYNDPAAVAVLCDFVRDGDERLRLGAAQQLSMMHLHPEIAIPALIAFLKEDYPRAPPHQTDRLVAMSSLERFGPQAAPAVPALLALLNRKSKETDGDARNERRVAVQVLRTIDPDNMNLFIRLLEHSDWEIRSDAARMLGYHFGPKAKAAVPALVKMLGEKHSMSYRDAALMLLRIDPEAAHKAGVPKGYN
jgi:hypothetical protein